MFIVIDKKKIRNISIVIVVILVIIFILIGRKNIFAATLNEKTYMAIVIDDFGNNGAGTEEMMNLDIPLTAAIMPFGESASMDARLAKEKGKEVIIHMPMEPEVGRESWLGKTPILATLSNEEVEKRTRNAMDILKEATGMNNHMGSRVMQNERIVNIILDLLKEKNMFFLDSKTTQKSVAEKLAKDKSIDFYERDIFLDHISTQSNVEKQMEEAIKVSKTKGYVIVIGHVGAQGGKITVKGINNKISRVKSENIELVTLSQLREKLKQ